MDQTQLRLLEALRCAMRGEAVTWSEPVPDGEWRSLARLAQEHSVQPLVINAVYRCPSFPAETWFGRSLMARAKKLTLHQARRTADFLLLYQTLERSGLSPAVMKGIVCRSLYPEPEQRASVDEDLLIAPEDFPRYHEALIGLGLHPLEALASDHEIPYQDDDQHLYLEVHMSPFPLDSEAYGDCNQFFSDVLSRTTRVQVEDVSLRTLEETDHLLYLICHAYKHFLHSGVGIRQICDMAIFVEANGDRIDWQHILEDCRTIRIERFAAALFRIADRYLGYPVPQVFAEIKVDEEPLLEDILSGGLYGANDINRLHSSTLTLDAVASSKSGRRRGGVLRSVFLPAKRLEGRFPYLKKKPWLLPVAWTQRVWQYVTKRQKVNPAESVRIGQDRIRLLKQYGIIE